jgi:hypothetical protein
VLGCYVLSGKAGTRRIVSCTRSYLIIDLGETGKLADTEEGRRKMAQIIFAVFYGLTKLLFILFGLPFALLSERQPKSSPLSLPLKLRFEHTHIVGGSGHGKTQLLQHMIATQDLSEVAAGRRSLVVMDSQGDLIRNILRLAEFSPGYSGGCPSASCISIRPIYTTRLV